MNRSGSVQAVRVGEFVREFCLSTLFVLVLPLLLLSNAHAQSPGSMPRLAVPRIPGVSDLGQRISEMGILDLSRQSTPFGTPAFYGGILVENGSHVFHEVERKEEAVHGIRAIKHKYPQEGVFLGLSDRLAFGNDFDIRLEGWVLIPIESRASSSYAATDFVGQIEGSLVTRQWAPRTRAWYLDSALLYGGDRVAFIDGVAQILGVRYDLYQRSFDQVSSDLPSSSGDDKLDVTVKTVVPYIGMEYQMGGEKYHAILRFLLSPAVIGNLSYTEDFGSGGYTDEGSFDFDVIGGYWGELFVNASVHTSRDVSFGGFLKMTSMSFYGDSSLKTSYTNGRFETARYDITYRRIIYTVGANLTIVFSSPFGRES